MQEEQNNNPYPYQVSAEAVPAAPSTRQAAPQPPLGQGPVLRAEPAKQPWKHGQLWLTQAWTLFKAEPGTWMGMILALLAAYMVMAVVSSFMPFGNLVLSLLAPVGTAGFVLGAYSLDERQGLRFEHLWSGFQHKNLGQLILLGAITIAGSLVAMLPMLVTMVLGFGFNFASSGAQLNSAVLLWLALGFLISMALMLPLMMALWFAPALVVLNDVPAIEAMKRSLAACWRNMGAFFIYGLIMLGLGFVAVFTLFLAYIVILPVIYISYYTSYRDVLTEG